MAIDASIYSQLLQPVKSVDDYKAESQNKQLNALTLLLKQQQVQQGQQATQDDAALRRTLSSMNPAASVQDRVAALRSAGTPAAWKQAQDMEKADLDAGKSRAETSKWTTEAAGHALSVMKTLSSSVMGNPTPQNAMAALDMYERMTGQNASAERQQIMALGSDPQKIKQWASAHALTAEQMLPKFQQIDAGNRNVLGSVDPRTAQFQPMQEIQKAPEGFNVGPNGELSADPGFLAAKKQIASAGGTKVNIGVNTEKSYAGHVAEGLAKNDVSALDTARTAPDRVNTARSIKQILDGNKAITGTGADARLAVTKALSTAGIIDGGSTTATEDLVSMLNSQTLDAIKSSGLGSGQGFTDKDRQFLQDAKSGRIAINAQTLYRMADLNEKAGLASIEYGNKIAARLKGNPTMGSVGQDLTVTAPDSAALSKAIEAEAARRAKLRGGK